MSQAPVFKLLVSRVMEWSSVQRMLLSMLAAAAEEERSEAQCATHAPSPVSLTVLH